MTEFQSTINNGLPIRVREPSRVPPARISGSRLLRRPRSALLNGKPCFLDLTPEDDRRLSDELFEAASEPPCDY